MGRDLPQFNNQVSNPKLSIEKKISDPGASGRNYREINGNHVPETYSSFNNKRFLQKFDKPLRRHSQF